MKTTRQYSWISSTKASISTVVAFDFHINLQLEMKIQSSCRDSLDVTIHQFKYQQQKTFI